MVTAASRRFSSSHRFASALARRSRLLIGAFVAVAVGVAVAVVATNGFEFGHRTSARDRVSAYVKQVDGVEQQMSFQVSNVMAAYRAYTKGSQSSATVAQLKESERTLRELGVRVAALPAPPQAARLRTLLVSLLSAERDVAHEVTGLAQFTPPFHAVAAQTQLLSAELSKALAAVPQPKPHLIRGTKKQIAKAQAAFAAAAAQAAGEQAKVIDAYDAGLTVLLGRLSRLVVPRAMAPTYTAEVATLRATRKAGTALAAGLRAPKRSNVAALSRKFSLAARTAGSVVRQQQAIAAVKAYDARVKRIGTLELAVQKEFARLSNALK